MTRQRRLSSILRTTLVITAFISFANYFTTYHLSLQHSMSDYDESVLLLSLNYHENGTGVHANETKQPLSVMQTGGRSRFRQLNVTEFPYKCGLVLFYHIPCTGGASINRWFKNRIGPTTGIEYFTFWGRNQTARNSFAKTMESQLQNPFGWRLSQAHGCSLLPIQDEENLSKWRNAVESQGCKFILATVVRDALSHTISQLKEKQYEETKSQNRGEHLSISMKHWVNYLGMSNQTATQQWSSQLDYFLFNCWDKNNDLNFALSREDKVLKAIHLLRNHYDLVVYQDHDLFVKIITNMIGFEPISLRSSNQHKLEINFTSQELALLKQKIHENGDADFINAVRHIYSRHLQYLVG